MNIVRNVAENENNSISNRKQMKRKLQKAIKFLNYQ